MQRSEGSVIASYGTHKICFLYIGEYFKYVMSDSTVYHIVFQQHIFNVTLVTFLC